MKTSFPWVVCLASLALLACGARTPIDEGDAGTSSGGSGSGGTGSGGSNGGSGSSSGGNGLSVFCDVTMGGLQVCLGYGGLNGVPFGEITSVCQQQGGMIVSACSPNGQVGCCGLSAGGYVVTACYYCPTQPSMVQQACTSQPGATWTEPSGGPAPCGG